MSKIYTRISIPVRHPLKMLDLAANILDRHTELGVNSPLEGSDEITELTNVYPMAKEKHEEGSSMHALGEASIQGAKNVLGRGILQTINEPGTVYYYMGRIRTLLQLYYQGKEEEISTFGFQVVINNNRKRRYVRIRIPSNSIRNMEELAGKIIERHQELGNDSPLKDKVDMAHFESQYLLATTKRSEGNAYHAKAEAAFQAAYRLLGIDKGQNINTEGTIYYLFNRIRSHLLLAYQGVQEEISTFGFNVVISSGVSRKKKLEEGEE